jgi:hypothetical protein
MFLYAGYVYDPEAPWQGLLRSDILIFVRSLLVVRFLLNAIFIDRVSNTYLPLQVSWQRSQKPCILAMHTSMG